MGIRFLAGYREAQAGVNAPPQVPTAEDVDSQHRPAAMKAGGQSGQGGQKAEAGSQGSGVRSQESATPTRSVSEGSGTQARSASEGKPRSANGNGHANGKHDADLLERAGAQLRIDGNGPAVRSEQFARFQLDAPSCDNCGAITVRNGNCYLCHNCGNSMGCS
jgi:ribonucleoside-diphosphate reductase alpha chain